MEELSRALADCKISIDADTLERLIEREGMLDKEVGGRVGAAGTACGWLMLCML